MTTTKYDFGTTCWIPNRIEFHSVPTLQFATEIQKQFGIRVPTIGFQHSGPLIKILFAGCYPEGKGEEIVPDVLKRFEELVKEWLEKQQ